MAYNDNANKLMTKNVNKIKLTKNVIAWKIYFVSEVGRRLKNAREAKGLSLRKFAKGFRENFTLLCHIEKGRRFPPKGTIKKFAEVLSLTPDQLEALIAVERRGLDPNQMLPEIAPAPVKRSQIEDDAGGIWKEFKEKHGSRNAFEGPIPIEDVIMAVSDLRIEEIDFEQEQIVGPRRGPLCGCFYPEGRRGKGRVILVNSGKINGARLSNADRRVTIAHEAGHYFLHYANKKCPQLLFHFTKEPTYCREAEIDSSGFNSKEHQANLFGACLLLPKDIFLTEWRRLDADVVKLAKRFDVTEQFVRLRLKSLCL